MRENAARVAAENSRKLTLPKTPADYKFGLSPNFKPPQGMEFKLNENDPLVPLYRDFAHKRGFDQDTFTEGMDLIAALRVGEEQKFGAARTQELAKLGATASDRIAAVTQWATAMGGDKAAGFVDVLKMAPRADTVEFFEAVMQKFTSQGASSFSRSGQTNTDANGGKIPGYEKMSFEQRRQAQDQQRQRAAG